MEKNTREIIQENSIQLFLEKGFENTTIMDICNACNITKRTFYYHFDSKKDIITNIIHEQGKQAKKALLEEIANPSNLDKIWIVMSKYCISGEEYGPDIIKQVYLCSLEKNSSEHFPMDTDMFSVVVQLIQNAIVSKELTTTHAPEKLAFILYHAFRSVTITWAFENGSFSLQEAYLECFNTILK